MTGPRRDPRFPDRPQHPDFWRMSKVIVELDEQADRAADEAGEAVVITPDIDQRSLAYVARQRVIRARNLLPEDPEGNTTGRDGILWADGFTAGVRYAQALAEEQDIEIEDLTGTDKIDGNRRQRRAKGKR